MDVRELVDRLPEPTATDRLRQLLTAARSHLTPWQTSELSWDELGPFDLTALNGMRCDAGDAARIRGHATELALRLPGELPADDDERWRGIPWLLTQAEAKPAVVSAILWTWLGARHPVVASHLLQLVRERAGLPGLRRRLTADEPTLGGGDNLPALVARCSDRQVEDTCAWLERIPAPFERATLASQTEAIERDRAAAPRLSADEFTGFARRAAAFLVHLSVARLDPLGFPLAREVELEADPPLERRLQLAAWARRSGHLICPRGQQFVLRIPVVAPWPLHLELIAAELGHGAGGGLGLLLRLDAGGTIAVTGPTPVLLLFPAEPDEERGSRFERWLSDAYPRATQPWHAWS